MLQTCSHLIAAFRHHGIGCQTCTYAVWLFAACLSQPPTFISLMTFFQPARCSWGILLAFSTSSAAAQKAPTFEDESGVDSSKMLLHSNLAMAPSNDSHRRPAALIMVTLWYGDGLHQEERNQVGVVAVLAEGALPTALLRCWQM